MFCSDFYLGFPSRSCIHVQASRCIMLSNDLTCQVHVDYVLKKANSRLYAPRKLRRAGLNQSDLVNVYCSLVITCLEYASPSWASLSATLSEDIESPQRRVLRIIYPELSYMDTLVVSGLDFLANRRHEQWRSQPDNWSCTFSCVYSHRPYKESISKEMNNDDLNLNLHDQMSGWLRHWA